VGGGERARAPDTEPFRSAWTESYSTFNHANPAEERSRVVHSFQSLHGFAEEDAAAAGGEINTSVHAGIAGHVVDPAELMLVVVDAGPGRARIVRAEEAGGIVNFSEEE
jgi:hypothetical protein